MRVALLAADAEIKAQVRARLETEARHVLLKDEHRTALRVKSAAEARAAHAEARVARLEAEVTTLTARLDALRAAKARYDKNAAALQRQLEATADAERTIRSLKETIAALHSEARARAHKLMLRIPMCTNGPSRSTEFFTQLLAAQ
ncbi:MAG: hypothetical protein EOO41_04585 [Methanobacteriota archaeon]|nr:MAG: hypothetical protein EOO41_04585 [Euryarchaeota archaeon]